MAGWIKKRERPNYMLLTRDLLQLQGHTQAQGQAMKKDIPYKWKQKESRGSDTSNRQNRL